VKPFRAWVLGGLLLTASASAQVSDPVEAELLPGNLSITVVGDLDFGTHFLTGVEQQYNAQSAPEVQVVDARGTGAGWFVTLEASDFEAGSQVISANSLTYNAAGGLWNVIHGQAVSGAGPLETGQSGPLSTPLRVAEAGSGAGMGTYRWYPAPASFTIVIPGTARAGVYRSTLTFSISSGP
jgi:hypothetical protein